MNTSNHKNQNAQPCSYESIPLAQVLTGAQQQQQQTLNNNHHDTNKKKKSHGNRKAQHLRRRMRRRKQKIDNDNSNNNNNHHPPPLPRNTDYPVTSNTAICNANNTWNREREQIQV